MDTAMRPLGKSPWCSVTLKNLLKVPTCQSGNWVLGAGIRIAFEGNG